jgi:hypothetical protein
MESSFYTDGRGDLCPHEQRGGTMLNPPISFHVLFGELSFQLYISVCLGCCRTPQVIFLLILPILREIQN